MNDGNGCFSRVREWLAGDAVRERLARALPRGVSLDGWIEAALIQAKATKGIGVEMPRTGGAYADPVSVLGAIFVHATLGLRLEGPLGQAYFQCQAKKRKDPRSGRWEVESVGCAAGVGYKGLCALAYQDPLVREPEAVLVYTDDEFEAIKGTTPVLTHHINVTGTSQRIKAAYAGLRYKDGYYSFQAFRGAVLEEHRRSVLLANGVEVETDSVTGEERFFETWDGQRKALSDSRVRGMPWAAHGPAMLQKTALRWAAKYWNLGANFDTAAHLLSLEEAGLSQGLADTGRAVLAQAAGKPRAVDVHAATPGLVDQLVVEATRGGGEPLDDPPKDPPTAPVSPDPTAMTAAEIEEALALERREAAAFAQEHPDDEVV